LADEQEKFLQRLPEGTPALAQRLAAQAGELARLAESA
jgi:hypothetical protein